MKFPQGLAATVTPHRLQPASLVLSHGTVTPGEVTVATGTGCVPGTPVVLSIGGKAVGVTAANGGGTFSASIDPPDQGAGQVAVTAVCGPTQMTALLSIVVTSRATNPEGSAAVFGVFVLLGLVLLRGQLNGNATRRRRRPRAADLLDIGRP